MEDEIEKKLSSLMKYIPFIQYILEIYKETNKKLFAQYTSIKNWIITRKRYPIRDLEKIEQSIQTQYKNLFLEVDVKIPKEIMDIFNSLAFGVKCININLCSDESESDDDVQFVSATNHSERNPVLLLKSEEVKNEVREIIVSEQKDTDQKPLNEELFTRRTRVRSETCEDHNEQSSISNASCQNGSAGVTSLQSKSEERALCSPPSQIPNERSPTYATSYNFSTHTISSPQNQSNTSLSTNDLQSKSLPELEQLFQNLTEHTDVDIDKLLKVLVYSKESDNNNLAGSAVIDDKFPQEAPVEPHHGLNTMPQIHASQSSGYPTAAPNQLPICIFNNLRRVNLNDPRILKQLKIIQSRPQYSGLAKENATMLTLNYTGNSQSSYFHKITPAPPPAEPRTYQEYKLEKARKAAVEKQLEERKQKELEIAEANKLEQLRLLHSQEKSIHAEANRVVATATTSKEEVRLSKKHNSEHNKSIHKQLKENIHHPRAVHKKDIPHRMTNECTVEQQISVSYGQKINASALETEVQRTENELTEQSETVKDILINTLSAHKNELKKILIKTGDNYSIKNSDDVEKTSARSAPKKKRKKNKTTKHLPNNTDLTIPVPKKLECTIRGYDTVPNFITKRRSSVSARKAIAEQLHCNGLQITDSDDSASELEITSRPINTPSIEQSKPESEGSSDTDVFDYDDALLNKNNKRVEDLKRAVVVMKRLTAEEIAAHTQPGRYLNVQLVESKSESAPIERKPAKIRRPKVCNVDPKMTEHNTTFCLLCKSRPADLTNHYVHSHNSESYVSRLNAHVLEDLQENIRFAEPTSSGFNRTQNVRKYLVKCVFCNFELTEAFTSLHQHYSSHTGEYAFQCSACNLKKPYRADILSHQLHSKLKECRYGRVQPMYQYQSQLRVIYGHCCKICNFVQLNEANIFKHLRDHHGKKQDNPVLVEKYILAAIRHESTAPQHHPDSMQDIAGATTPIEVNNNKNLVAEVTPDADDDGIVVSNEPFDDDESLIPVACNVLGSFNNDVNEPRRSSHSATTCQNDSKKAKQTQNAGQIQVDDPITIIGIPSRRFTQTVHTHTPIQLESLDVKPDVNELYREKSQVLKPTLRKPHESYRKYPASTSYFGLYKCMATDCFYTTDSSGDMLTHVQQHIESECPPDGSMDCAYCQIQVGTDINSPQNLIDHVQKKHGHNRFQCPHCCYRSCLAGNVAIHRQIAHTAEMDESTIENFVYRCEGRLINVSDRLPHMMKNLSENVKQLKCSKCPSAYYAISSLLKHVTSVHHEIAFDSDKYHQYVCIYCGQECSHKKLAQEHLSIEHPDEFAYLCERELKKGLIVDSVQNLQLINVAATVLPKNIREGSCTSFAPAHCVAGLNPTQQSLVNSEIATDETNLEVIQTAEAKPSLDELTQISIATILPILSKLTRETGVLPDRLYCCAESTCGGLFSIYELWARHMSTRHKCVISRCPHCVTENVELSIRDFEEHFELHRRHLFVCYYCDMTFASEPTLTTHGKEAHKDIINTHLASIPINPNHAYYVLISNDLHPDRIQFLHSLQHVLLERLAQRAKLKSQTILSKWKVPYTDSWLEDYPAFTRHLDKCFLQLCPYRSEKPQELFEHMRDKHELKSQNFTCGTCSFTIKCCSDWKMVFDHIRTHTGNIFVCCTCRFSHFDRQVVAMHITECHASRDTALLSVFRSVVGCDVSLAILFAENSLIFTTMKTCFCCKLEIGVATMTMHLKKMHGLKLNYFCELCNDPINDLQLCGNHFQNKHDDKIKLRCELSSHRQLRLQTVQPLCITVEGETVTGKRKMVEELDNVNSKRMLVDLADVKKEREECDDDDVLFLDHDDCVANDQAKKHINAATTNQLKCINIVNLLQPAMYDTPPQHIHNTQLLYNNSDVNMLDSRNYANNNWDQPHPSRLYTLNNYY